MKLAIICFTLTGLETASKISRYFEERHVMVELAKKSRYLPDSVSCSTVEWTEKQFAAADGILFVGACGIAVRSIAPFVAGKKSDPAVLVVDECGKFVISLLSGHLGGANELTETVASVLGAIPVVTTATDLHGRFAVDVFARKHQCEIFPMSAAKAVSAALLSGETVGFFSEFPVEGETPDGLLICDHTGESHRSQSPKTGVAVTIHTHYRPFETTVYLVPKLVSLGMGCRKGKGSDAVFSAALQALDQASVYREAVRNIASIDIKKEEPGLVALAEEFQVPFLTFSGEKLLQTPGNFTPSSFVKDTVGVDNVCERSAVCAAENGTLIKPKHGADGVTTALAVKDWRIVF